MRRVLPALLLLLLFAPAAQAEVRTLGAHNVITVDGVGYFDVRIERDTEMYRANMQEGIHFVWKIRSDRADVFQALRLLRYGGGGGGIASGSGSSFGVSGTLPAGDYRFYVASPEEPVTLTIDVEGFEGDRSFTTDHPVMGGGGRVPKIAELEDGTDVYGRSVYLDTPGVMFLDMVTLNDGDALLEQAGGCEPLGRETEPTVEDFGPGCPDDGHYSRRNQAGSTWLHVPAGWAGYGTWAQGILGEPATRETQAIWIAQGPPLIAPVWPADVTFTEPVASGPPPTATPAPQADPQPEAKPKRKAKPKSKAKKRKHKAKSRKAKAKRRQQARRRRG